MARLISPRRARPSRSRPASTMSRNFSAAETRSRHGRLRTAQAAPFRRRGGVARRAICRATRRLRGQCGQPERLGRLLDQLGRRGRLRLSRPAGRRWSEPGQAARNDAPHAMRASDRLPHLTPLVRASAGLLSLRVTGSFRGRGWAGGLLIGLMPAIAGPKSAKQAENGLTGLHDNFIDRLKRKSLRLAGGGRLIITYGLNFRPCGFCAGDCADC